MSNWYVMRTIPEKEEKAIALMQRTLNHKLWIQCRVLRKQKLLRSGGRLYVYSEEMFPGYIFIQTDFPEELQEELQKSREFPKLIGNQQIDIVPVEEEDLQFLKSVCGENLNKEMEISKVEVDNEGALTGVEGILRPYRDRIVKKRLRGRYVLVAVKLFNREEDVLFGIRLESDEIGKAG